MSLAKEELDLMISDECLFNIPVLIFANKQDLNYALTVVEVAD
jgi:signal recognition particle receptor subunit beta